MEKLRGNGLLLLIAIALVFGGGWLAATVQTGGGSIDVRDIRFAGSNGHPMSALLYVPDNATAEHPAPGVVAIHGYINSREHQSPYAIELARRGYVVLAVDQTGHGYSAPPAFANGFGGPDALAYLRTLDIVDKDQVVLSGHSMGGWASLIAAGTHPNDYRSIVVSGSSTGVYGAPDGNPEFPRNFGLVFGKYDEFSSLMWSSPTGAGIVDTEKLRTVFGTDTAVRIGHLYGNIDNGSARRLYMPEQTHPANHITAAGVAPVIDWVQATTSSPRPLTADDQVWQWKELGTALSLLGAILFLFPFGSLLLELAPFNALRQSPPAPAGIRGGGWWVAAALFVLIPVLTYFPLQALAALIPANALLPQNVTTGIMVWAVGTGLISLILFLLWHSLSARKGGADAASYGLVWGTHGTGGMILRSLLFGALVVGAAYLLLALTDWLFTTDFRLWVVAIKPLSALHWRIFLGYVVPFTLFFLVLGLVLHGQLRGRDSGLGRAMLRNAVLMGLGIALLLAAQYVPLLGGGTLAIADTGATLLTIVAIQFLVLLPVVGLISTYFFQRTGHIYAGAFVNGLLITWIVVGGQATHYAF